MKFTDEDGKVWEGEYTDQLPGGIGLRWVLMAPAPTIHEFGGVKFEETGEERCARPGEWCFLPEERLVYWDKGMHDNHPRISRILRPLQGEKEPPKKCMKEGPPTYSGGGKAVAVCTLPYKHNIPCFWER